MKTKRLFTIFIFGVCIIASALFLGINTAHAAKAEQTLDNKMKFQNTRVIL